MKLSASIDSTDKQTFSTHVKQEHLQKTPWQQSHFYNLMHWAVEAKQYKP